MKSALPVHPVASKIPILLIRLGLKRFDSGLAIMGFEDAESPRPIPVLADLRGRMDEPTAAIRHRLPSRRESSPQGTAWRPTASAQRRSATASGGQGQTTDTPGSGGGRPHRDAGDTIGVAPETNCPQIRRNCPARAGTAAHRRRDRGFGGSHGRRESGLGLPAHTRRALQSRLPNRARDRRQYPEAAWHGTSARAEPEDGVERIPQPALGADRGRRLFHHRDLDPQRIAAFPGAILHRAIHPQGPDRRHRLGRERTWMSQIARNLTAADEGILSGKRYLIHDRDPLFTDEFLNMLADTGVKSVRLPPNSPNVNAYAERFVRSIKESCLERMIFFGEGSLRKAIHEFVAHYHTERNHQGLGNRLIIPDDSHAGNGGTILCRERLGGMLNYYYRQAA